MKKKKTMSFHQPSKLPLCSFLADTTTVTNQPTQSPHCASSDLRKDGKSGHRVSQPGHLHRLCRNSTVSGVISDEGGDDDDDNEPLLLLLLLLLLS